MNAPFTVSRFNSDGERVSLSHVDDDPLAPRSYLKGKRLEPVVLIRAGDMTKAWQKRVREEAQAMFPGRHIEIMLPGIARVHVTNAQTGYDQSYRIEMLAGRYGELYNPDTEQYVVAEYLAVNPWRGDAAIINFWEEDGWGNTPDDANAMLRAADKVWNLVGKPEQLPNGRWVPASIHHFIARWNLRFARAHAVPHEAETRTNRNRILPGKACGCGGRAKARRR